MDRTLASNLCACSSNPQIHAQFLAQSRLVSMSDTPSLYIPGKESRSRHVAKRICFVPCASAFTMRKNGAGFHATSILEEYSQHHGVSKPSLGHPLGLSLMMSGPSSCGQDSTWKRRIFPFMAQLRSSERKARSIQQSRPSIP